MVTSALPDTFFSALLSCFTLTSKSPPPSLSLSISPHLLSLTPISPLLLASPPSPSILPPPPFLFSLPPTIFQPSPPLSSLQPSPRSQCPLPLRPKPVKLTTCTSSYMPNPSAKRASSVYRGASNFPRLSFHMGRTLYRVYRRMASNTSGRRIWPWTCGITKGGMSFDFSCSCFWSCFWFWSSW